jgi:hypothetical protein
MTDQIYYKIQYPLKKAIEIIKDVDENNPIPGECTEEDLEKIRGFINKWENSEKEKLKNMLKSLRKKI